MICAAALHHQSRKNQVLAATLQSPEGQQCISLPYVAAMQTALCQRQPCEKTFSKACRKMPLREMTVAPVPGPSY